VGLGEAPCRVGIRSTGAWAPWGGVGRGRARGDVGIKEDGLAEFRGWSLCVCYAH
jgi:hypothetical protein